MEIFRALFFLLLNILGILISGIPGFHPNNLSFISRLPLEISLPFAISLSVSYNFSQAIASSFGYRNYGFLFSRGNYKKIIWEGFRFSLLILFLFPAFYLVKILYNFKLVIPSLLTFVLSVLILKDKNKELSLYYVLISGIFGFLVLNMSLCRNPILPMFSGFFALPSILFYRRDDYDVQENSNYLMSFLSLFLISLLPAMTPSISSLFLSRVLEVESSVVTGGVNFVEPLVNIYTWYFIGKPREGIFQVVFPRERNIILLSFLVSIYLLSFATNIILFERLIPFFRFIYSKKAISIALNIFTVFLFSGIMGLLILFFSFLIGLDAWKDRKEYLLMSSLMIPTIYWYL